MRDYGLDTIIRICCAGSDGDTTARDVCAHIRGLMEDSYLSHHDFRNVLKALFEVQPAAALDVFLLPRLTSHNQRLFEPGAHFRTPVENMDSVALRQWADQDPTTRYPLLANAISMFSRKDRDDENGLSPLFLDLLNHAPDRRAFLGDFFTRLHPTSWSGSLADIFIRRKAQVLTLRDNQHADVRQWVNAVIPQLDRWIEHERKNDRKNEESFE